MASFQVHEDQENRNVRNLRSSKATISNSRSVLGILNNNSRIPSRPTRNDGKGNNGTSKEIKSSNAFTVHQDKLPEIKEEIKNKNKSSAFTICQDEKVENRKKVTSTITSKQAVASTSGYMTKISAEENDSLNVDKLEVPTVAVTNASLDQRHPLKDLKLIDEEEPMSEGSFVETCDASPMIIDKSLTLTISPASPQIKSTGKQKDLPQSLYDMEEYRKDIFLYLREAETRHRPKPCYMHRQPDVTYSMRTVLVDWLVEVAEEYRLHTETLYLAVSFIDRFLSIMSVVRGKLQLLGTAAMFIASKYEEIYPPEVSEFVYITDDTYNKKQVLRMEHLILKVLKFDFSIPTPLAFLTHLSVECKLPEKNLHLAMYLCELSLLEGDPYLQYLPSLIACAAIALARHCLEYDEVWPEVLSSASGYNLEELASCICNFNETHRKAKTLQQQAVYEKYKDNKWHNASEIPHRQLIVASSS